MRTCWWISPLSETGSSSCARASSLIPLPMARSSGGRLPGRPAGRALHQPEECATSLFPHDGGHDLMDNKSIVFAILGSLILLLAATGCAGPPTASPTAPLATPTSTAPSAPVVLAPSPRIEITPSTALVDEKVSIRLIGATPSQPVTLRARAQDDRQVVWESHATFRADNAGMVDVALQKPITGTYRDLDPMGLFWSMGIESRFSTGSAFAKTGLKPTPVAFSADADRQLLATATLERIFVAPDVTQTTVRDNGLAGILFKPSGSVKRPALIVVGGSEGG